MTNQDSEIEKDFDVTQMKPGKEDSEKLVSRFFSREYFFSFSQTFSNEVSETVKDLIGRCSPGRNLVSLKPLTRFLILTNPNSETWFSSFSQENFSTYNQVSEIVKDLLQRHTP